MTMAERRALAWETTFRRPAGAGRRQTAGAQAACTFTAIGFARADLGIFTSSTPSL